MAALSALQHNRTLGARIGSGSGGGGEDNVRKAVKSTKEKTGRQVYIEFASGLHKI